MINANSTVSDARNGDLFAFQSLVDRYQAPIARYMYRLVGDSASVRSLTVDVFVRAKKQLKRVDQTIRFEAWLYRLATSVAASELRRRRLTGWLHRGEAPQASMDDDADGQAVQKAMAAVPLRAASCFLLWYLGGFTYEEISSILRTSRRSVQSAMGQARQILRGTLLPARLAPTGPDCGHAQLLLSPYLDRQLSGEERSTAERHLATCPSCQETLSAYQDLDRRMARLRSRASTSSVTYDVMRTLRGEPVKVERPQRRRSPVVVLLLLLFVVLASASAALAIAGGGKKDKVPAGGTVYVGLQSSGGEIVAVDVASAKVAARIEIGARPLRLAVTHDGRRLYALGDNGILHVIDTVQNTVTDRFQLPGRPADIALAPEGKTLYVSLSDRASVLVLDSDDAHQTAEIRVGRTPRELAVTPDGQWVLAVTGNGFSVSKIKVSSKRETKIYSLARAGDQTGLASTLRPMAVAPDSRKAYVSDLQHERMWTIDLVTDTVTPAAVPLRDFGRDIAVAPDGSRVLITHGDPRGERSQLAGLAALALPQLERTEEIRGFLHGVALNPDGSLIFATNPDDGTMIIADAKTLQTIASITLGQRPTVLVYASKTK